MTKPLDQRSARTDLTDRECTKILGGVLGALSQMTDLETLRDAVRWWAEEDRAWDAFATYKRSVPLFKQALSVMAQSEPADPSPGTE